MWVVAKYNTKEFFSLKKEFKKILGDSTNFYIPKIRYKKIIGRKTKIFDKFILEGYLICYHTKFNDQKTLVKLKHTKGLSYFLEGYKNSQKEIFNFVNYCKKFENKEGYITQNFFNNENIKRVKFMEGPFTNMVFDIISRNKNKLKILVGNLTTIIDNNSCYLYRPV